MVLSFKEVFSVPRRILPNIAPPQQTPPPFVLPTSPASPFSATTTTTTTSTALPYSGGESESHVAGYQTDIPREGDGGIEGRFLSQFSYATARDINLRIVGQELDHHLLYAYDTVLPGSTKKCTVIDMINVAEQDTSPPRRLYNHTESIEIITASVNAACTLLAFSTAARFQSLSAHTALQTAFDSYWVDLTSKKPTPRSFECSGANYQRVQFLTGDGASGSRVSHMILFRHLQAIDVYSFSAAGLSQRQIHTGFVWMQYDLHRRAVYLLYLSNSGTSCGYEVRFKCITFSRNEHEVKIDTPLPIESIYERFSNINSRTYTLPSCSRSLISNGFNMQVVHMSGGGLCVCVQHAPPRDTGSTARAQEVGGTISYTVFVLHRSCAIEYSLSLERNPTSVVHAARLHFSAINNLLLVYAPGLVLQLLDCCVDHEPCHHLGFVETNIPTLPLKALSGSQTPLMSHFELARQHTSSKLIGPSLFDAYSGTAYQLSIDCTFLLNLFTTPQQTSTKIIALHIILVHVEKITFLPHLCHKCPEALDVPFLKEYLVGAAYSALRVQKDKEIIRLLPVTTIPNFYDEQTGIADSSDFADHCEWAKRRFFYLSREQLVEGLASPQNQRLRGTVYDSLTLLPPHQESPRFSFDQAEDWMDVKSRGGAGAGATVTAPLSDNAPVTNFFKRLLRTSSIPAVQASGPLNQEDPMRQLQSRMLRSFREHLQRWVGPHMKDRCPEWEEFYRNSQNMLAVSVFEAIKNSPAPLSVGRLGNDEHAVRFHSNTVLGGDEVIGVERPDETPERAIILFRLFERLYCAAQDLCFPLAGDFNTSFLWCAYQSLPRPLFSQYVSAGALHLTFEFVTRVITDAKRFDRPDDHEFVMSLLTFMDAPTVFKLASQWKHQETKRRLAQAATAAMLGPADVELMTNSNSDATPRGAGFVSVSVLMSRFAGKQSYEFGVAPGDIENAALSSTTSVISDPFEALDWVM